MLVGLSIRDVVLIDKLDMAFPAGLSVLTGETGAGKSILLDSLGLALGARADSGLIRPGAAQLTVVAEFAPPSDHPAWAILAEQALDAEGTLVLRRVVGADGRSRAFINDQPVSVGLLGRLGDSLVEVHGQFDSASLLDGATHRGLLDAFGGIDGAPTRAAWVAWRACRQARLDAEAALAKASAEEDLLRHAVDELTALDVKAGEEADLASRRSFLMHGEKLAEAIGGATEALNRAGGVGQAIRAAARCLERVADKAEGRIDPILAALERASIETAEAGGLIERLAAGIDQDGGALERVEQRLFALRAVARKHAVGVDDLPALRQNLVAERDALDAGGAGIARLAAAETAARAAYLAAAETLTKQRQTAATRFDRAVAAELAPLKLDRATFRTLVAPLPEEGWGSTGADAVAFEVSTNPGMPPGPLGKIASGGERARFMLALKVVLAAVGAAPTIVFDEVDSGIGGAVAAAVGERLVRLAGALQVLVVTHSPQVAARGVHHWHVSKHADGAGRTVTRVAALDPAARREEVARMLAGAQITDQARAAADSLLVARVP